MAEARHLGRPPEGDLALRVELQGEPQLHLPDAYPEGLPHDVRPLPLEPLGEVLELLHRLLGEPEGGDLESRHVHRILVEYAFL